MHIPFFRAKPTFWTGQTGRRINSLEHSDTARILAFYLFTAPDANPFGLYQLTLKIASIHMNKTAAELTEAFVILQDFEFAQYDEQTEFVWVYEMAEEQLNLPLNELDWKVRWVRKWWLSLEENPFLGPFFERYKDFLRLPERKPLRRGFQGAPKGLGRDNCTDTETVSVLKHESELQLKREYETESEKGGQGENKISKISADTLNRSWQLVIDASEKWFGTKGWAHLMSTKLVKIDSKKRYVIWCPTALHKKFAHDNAAKLREIAHSQGLKVNRFIFQEARQKEEIQK